VAHSDVTEARVAGTACIHWSDQPVDRARSTAVAQRWFGGHHFVYFAPVPLLVLADRWHLPFRDSGTKRARFF